jgi:hypothetical protein
LPPAVSVNAKEVETPSPLIPPKEEHQESPPAKQTLLAPVPRTAFKSVCNPTTVVGLPPLVEPPFLQTVQALLAEVATGKLSKCGSLYRSKSTAELFEKAVATDCQKVTALASGI